MKLNHLQANIDGQTRKATFEGREHLVVPVVILTEGVHNDIYYSAAELRKYVAAWNGIPLPVSHPVDSDGNPLSANTPDLVEKRSVGRLWNAEYKDDPPRIVAELWLDLEKTKAVSPRVLEIMEKGEKLEVSTGLWMDIYEVSGVWNDEKYDRVGVNFRPDHLALLPDSEGACSWSDGCGAPRVNQAGKEQSYILRLLKAIARKLGLVSNEVSHGDINAALQDKLNQGDNAVAGIFNMVVDVYDDYFVYRRDTPEGGVYLKRTYTSDETGNVELGSEAV
ncbi:MAG: hypothetical protein AB1896_19725, partial [Thermodesulfobacteriota bacterium]